MISVQAVQSAIRKKLIGNSTVTALVSDRIYTTHFYDFDNGTVEFPMVIIELEGGTANYGGGNQSVSFFLYSYSRESSSEAGEIYDALCSALHGEKLEYEGVSGFIQEVARPVSGYNPQARSYFQRGSWLTLSAG